MLTLKDSSREDVDLDVIDTPTSQLIGGVREAVDNAAETVPDAFAITGPDGERIAKASETAIWVANHQVRGG